MRSRVMREMRDLESKTSLAAKVVCALFVVFVTACICIGAFQLY
jgi:hypothetical protein